jgi:hypothetical protein
MCPYTFLTPHTPLPRGPVGLAVFLVNVGLTNLNFRFDRSSIDVETRR